MSKRLKGIEIGTKFGRRSSITVPQILERYCAILSRCVRVQDSYNSGPFKSKSACSLALAVIFISLVTWQRPASTSTDINSDKLTEFFVEKVEGVRAATSNVLPPPYVRHDASPQLLPSFHWGSAASDDAFACQVPLSTEKVKGVGWKLETVEVTHPLWKISGYATAVL